MEKGKKPWHTLSGGKEGSYNGIYEQPFGKLYEAQSK